MMNYEQFKETVKENFMNYMPDKFKDMVPLISQVEKVNSTLVRSLTIQHPPFTLILILFDFIIF